MIIKKLMALINWRKLNSKTQAFMFNSGTVFIETTSGILLIALAVAAMSKTGMPFGFGLKHTSNSIPLVIGVMQLLIAPLLCRNECWASRGLLAAVSSVIWTGVAINVYANKPPEILNLTGAIILAVAMSMAVINLVASRNTVDKARNLTKGG